VLSAMCSPFSEPALRQAQGERMGNVMLSEAKHLGRMSVEDTSPRFFAEFTLSKAEGFRMTSTFPLVVSTAFFLPLMVSPSNHMSGKSREPPGDSNWLITPDASRRWRERTDGISEFHRDENGQNGLTGRKPMFPAT